MSRLFESTRRRLLSAAVIVVVALLAPRLGHAQREAGLGSGIRAGSVEGMGWRYFPVLVPIGISWSEHLGLNTQVEIAGEYVAVRAGAVARACTLSSSQCVRFTSLFGLASARFGREERGFGALVAIAAAYDQGLGSSYRLRFEVELLAARNSDSWSKGAGMAAYLVRFF